MVRFGSYLFLSAAIAIVVLLASLFDPLATQVAVFGVLLGGFYAVIALGFALVFGVMRILNLAHGSMVVLGAYVTFWLFDLYRMSPLISWLAASVTLFMVGMLVQKLLLNPVMRFGHDLPMVVTFGLLLMMNSLFVGLWTANPRGILTEISFARILINGVTIPTLNLLLFIVSALALVLFATFLSKTRFGKAMRATSQNMAAARLVGIDVNRLYVISFALGSALAGFSGTLFASIFTFDPNSGIPVLVRALTVVVLAGTGNIGGLLFAGILLGVLESLGALFIGGGFRDAIAFVVFLVILLVKPTGLFGSQKT